MLFLDVRPGRTLNVLLRRTLYLYLYLVNVRPRLSTCTYVTLVWGTVVVDGGGSSGRTEDEHMEVRKWRG